MSSWIDANRVIRLEPGPRDVCVVTLVNGRVAALNHVLDYETAVQAASELARRVSCPLKVLPMGGTELIAFLGLRADHLAASIPDDAALRADVIRTCREALRECDDRTVRRDASQLLVALGCEA